MKVKFFCNESSDKEGGVWKGYCHTYILCTSRMHSCSSASAAFDVELHRTYSAPNDRQPLTSTNVFVAAATLSFCAAIGGRFRSGRLDNVRCRVDTTRHDTVDTSALVVVAPTTGADASLRLDGSAPALVVASASASPESLGILLQNGDEHSAVLALQYSRFGSQTLHSLLE